LSPKTDASRRAPSRVNDHVNDHVDGLVSSLLTASRVLVGVSARSLQEVDETVTVPQFRALVVLCSHGEINLNRLAEILDVNASSAMRMVDRLLAIGLVTRRENPDNRRHTLIGLAPEGVDVVRKVTVRRRREIKKLVSRMSANDSGALVDALRAFADAAGEPNADDAEVSALGW
jgi:DNA-binding MarR family transcriptional regulator